MQEAQAKPPYVTFEYRSVEDREATIEQGHYVGKDIAYAIITPQGSRDKIEKIAEEWLASTEAAVREERFPMDWLRFYKNLYKEWQEGRELPLEGTPILTWAAVSPAQQKAILDANIRTVEDLAAANESALSCIGIGARSLKDRATSWLKSAQEVGKTAERNAALEEQNQVQAKQIDDLTAQVKNLSAKVEALSKESA